MDGYLRIGFGDETDYMRQGLNRLQELLVELGAAKPAAETNAPASA
jgi:hypothetical protein